MRRKKLLLVNDFHTRKSYQRKICFMTMSRYTVQHYAWRAPEK